MVFVLDWILHSTAERAARVHNECHGIGMGGTLRLILTREYLQHLGRGDREDDDFARMGTDNC